MSLELDRSRWKSVTFGEVADRVRNQVARANVERYVAGGHFDKGSLKVNRWGHPDDGGMGSTFTYGFQAGHTLLVSASWYLRKTAIATFEGVVADKTYVLAPRDTNVLDPRFLPFLLLSDRFYDYAAMQATGSMNPRLLWSNLAKYEFDLPPLADQRRIADLLWACEEHERSLRSEGRALIETQQALIASLWETESGIAIGDIGNCVTGSTPSKANGEYWADGKVAFYTPSEIVGDCMSEAVQLVSKQGAAAGRMVPRNSVAIACIGGDMGKSAVVLVPGITNQQITCVVGLGEPDAFLLQALLDHPLGRAALETRETTTIVRKLNKSDLMKVRVPWPLNREAHQATAASLRSASLLVGDQRKLAKTLRSALNDALLGNVVK